jgi:5-methylcytosine-specific restriction endonuclease McrA
VVDERDSALAFEDPIDQALDQRGIAMREHTYDDAPPTHERTFYAPGMVDEEGDVEPGTGPGAPVRVAFLAATGRSGSTLVARVLGSLPGTCSVGELCWIWTYGLKLNRPCGCGAVFSECPFWTAVGQQAFGGWGQVDVEDSIRLRRELTRNRRVPELFVRPVGASRRMLDQYTSLMTPLYRSIKAVSGADVIIDNSKQAAVALVARRTPGIQLEVIHLVRRSHGVAHSWTKHVARSDNSGQEMRRRGPGRTALRWTADNAMFETLRATDTPITTIRYEDFVSGPKSACRELSTFLHIDPDSVDAIFPTDNSVALTPDHSVWGNPMRLRSGPEVLAVDEAWRTEMSNRDRREVTLLSWPALARYGYLGR